MMKPVIPYLLGLIWLLLSCPGLAATFTVNSDVDNAFAHDHTLGNGVCDVTPPGGPSVCTLRAALEEANTSPAIDTIFFDDSLAGTHLVLDANEGPLPPIIHPVFIVGESIAAYNNSATLLRNAPPQFFIDGSQLSGAHSGLLFDASTASGSIVTALGIVNFGGNGILIRNGANNLLIDRNYIGVMANGASAGNGFSGIHAAGTSGHTIGKRRNPDSTSYLGLGNVISRNGNRGIWLENSNNNQVHANLIGIAPAGTGDRGNGGRGIEVSGNNNDIGDKINNATAGNFIAGNDLGGILVIGNDHIIVANTLGKGETGGFINSEGHGVEVLGQLNFIGNINDAGNKIYEHVGSGIRIGGDQPANSNFIIGNQIGSAGSQFPLLLSGSEFGIDVTFGHNNVLVNNIVINSVEQGIFLRGTGNSLEGNQIGFVDSISGPLAEPNLVGIWVLGVDNTIGSQENPNHIGGNLGEGVLLSGSGDNLFQYNRVGINQEFEEIGNGASGVVITDSSFVSKNIIGFSGRHGIRQRSSVNAEIFQNFIGVTPNGTAIGNAWGGITIEDDVSLVQVAFNHIAFNNGDGVSLPGLNVDGVAIFQNSMHSNDGIGIDLNDDGVTLNDDGDTDEGPNRLQNYPVITDVRLNTETPQTMLTITYRVDSIADIASAYPLNIDFYWSDRDEDPQGRSFLHTDTNYTTPFNMRTILIPFPSGVNGGWLTATVTDQEKNTSEFAAQVAFGNAVDILFRDSFES